MSTLLAGIAGAHVEQMAFFRSDGSAVEMVPGHEVYDGSDSGEFYDVLDLLLAFPCLGATFFLYLYRRAGQIDKELTRYELQFGAEMVPR